MNVSETISQMYLEIINNPRHHKSTRKTFPRECTTEIFYTLEDIGDILTDRKIHVDIKLRNGLVSVEFRLFLDNQEMYPFEKKIREKFYGGD